MSAGSRWGPRGVALLILLTVLLVSSGLSGLPSEAAQATAQGGDVRAGRSLTVVGDINQDGIVDTRDYGLWRQRFGQQGAGNPADLNQDSIVDTRDYGIWRQNFGQQGPTPTPTVAATNCIPVGAICHANVSAGLPVSVRTGPIVLGDCASPTDPVNCAQFTATTDGFTVTGRFGLAQVQLPGVLLMIAVVDATTGAPAGTRTVPCPGTTATCNGTLVSGNVRPQLGGTVTLLVPVGG
jgi:hypothetical protein